MNTHTVSERRTRGSKKEIACTYLVPRGPQSGTFIPQSNDSLLACAFALFYGQKSLGKLSANFDQPLLLLLSKWS